LATPRVYEVLFIVKPDAENDELNHAVDTFQNIITGLGGTLIKNENMGRRQLAYKIRQGGAYYREGIYILFEIEGSGREIAELERRMRVSDLVIRYLTIRVDEDRRRAEKLRARRARKTSKRPQMSSPSQRNRPSASSQPPIQADQENE
jgi:small subunit ribosomal protein S6